MAHLTDTTAPRSGSGLVSSRDVTGTAVYSSIDGEHIGSVDHMMIDKVSGRVAYADISFGGFLGLAEDHHLVPWGKLSYAPDKGGFVTDLTRESLEGAPRRSEDWYRDRTYEERLYDHYRVPYYWI